MAREPMTLEEIRATRPDVDPVKVAATTEEDIRRHQIEDGEDPDAPTPPFRPTPNVRAKKVATDIARTMLSDLKGWLHIRLLLGC